MSGAKPRLPRRLLASAGLFCAVGCAFLIGGLWWKSTWEAEREVALRLASARERLCELESLAADGRALEAAWTALRDLGMSGMSRNEAVAEIRDVLRAKGGKAGVRIAKMDLLTAAEPVPGDPGCAIEVRTRVEGSSAAIVNWVYLLQASSRPMLWIDSVAWISGGDPSRMICEAVVRTAFLGEAGGS